MNVAAVLTAVVVTFLLAYAVASGEIARDGGGVLGAATGSGRAEVPRLGRAPRLPMPRTREATTRNGAERRGSRRDRTSRRRSGVNPATSGARRDRRGGRAASREASAEGAPEGQAAPVAVARAEVEEPLAEARAAEAPRAAEGDPAAEEAPVVAVGVAARAAADR